MSTLIKKQTQNQRFTNIIELCNHAMFMNLKADKNWWNLIKKKLKTKKLKTYCHVKLPVMPSLRRSRNDRCRLGPEPIGGNDVLPPRFMLLWIDNVVGLPDKFRLPDEFEFEFVVDTGAVDRIICLLCCAPDELFTNDRCLGDEHSREGDAITNQKFFFVFVIQFNWVRVVLFSVEIV